MSENNRLKIRVEYCQEDNERIAGKVVGLLEHIGFEVHEWTRPFPIKENPNSGIARSYITAIKKGKFEHGEK